MAASRVEGLIVAAVAITAAVVVGFFVGEDRGWMAGCAAGAISALIRIAWPLRRERWFWATMAALVGMNAFVVEHFDWAFTHSWGGRSVSALMLIDIAVMMAVIYGLFCLICGRPSEVVGDLVENPTYRKRDLDL